MLSDAVPVRDGATVVVARDGADGLEVLLLRRHSAAAFVPGAQCFPGGAVDPDDGTEPEAAARAAALRETFEETGLLLGVSRAPADGFDAARWRRAVHAGDEPLAAAADAAGVTVDGSALRLLGRWVTPPGEPRRFDCRFYVAPDPPGQEPEIDHHEHDDWAWRRPSDALAAAERGELFVIQPTIHTLATVDRFATVADLLAALDEADPDDRIQIAANGWQVRLPFDPVSVGR